jgi:hypothetical protein
VFENLDLKKQKKEFFQHPLFTKKALIVDVVEFTVLLKNQNRS